MPCVHICPTPTFTWYRYDAPTVAEPWLTAVDNPGEFCPLVCTPITWPALLDQFDPPETSYW